MKVRGELLALNCNVTRPVERHRCSLFAIFRSPEDIHHFITVCPILSSFRKYLVKGK
ncbi:hypothetical protein O3M35_002124 [Rhynocoris fuscipes]|uniref:Reverse transcriptase zinc-binding domain-containing protein n=1 Tax=Rhynocoris fuscipes TaxID=488301 RepID=A0AAW1CRD9_9HEMI